MKQQERSLLALVLCAAFLVTGKLFVWKKAKPDEIPYSDTNATEIADPAQTAVTGGSDVTSTTSTVTSTESSISDAADATTNTIMQQTTTTVSADAAQQTVSTSSAALTSASSASTTAQTTSSAAATTSTTAAPAPGGFTQAPEGYFNDALFIGDSRTVGQANWGAIEGATYFASVGMSTANIYKSESEVSTTKGMGFEATISARQYGKVYIMMGINELGNDRPTTLNNFSALLDRIRAAQPNAIIYIEANLHVTAARSEMNVYGVNNPEINSYNNSLAAFADDVNIFYLDVNPVFDDASGALAAENTRDGVHPNGSNYPVWKEWLENHVIVR